MNAIMGLPAAGMRVARVYGRWLQRHDAWSAREGQRGRGGYVRLLHRTSGDMLVSRFRNSHRLPACRLRLFLHIFLHIRYAALFLHIRYAALRRGWSSAN
jgi:hypothetical protein